MAGRHSSGLRAEAAFQRLRTTSRSPVSVEVREVLNSADVLVTGRIDLSLTSPIDISRVNVDGTRRLLEVHPTPVRRVLVLSSMSAFDGTTQLYGRAKLAIDA